MDNNNLNLEFLVVSAQHHARVTPSSRGKNVRPRCSPHLNNESELKKKKSRNSIGGQLIVGLGTFLCVTCLEGESRFFSFSKCATELVFVAVVVVGTMVINSNK